MTFTPASGTWKVIRTPSKASTTYTKGSLIANDGTNDVMATAQTQQYIRGILIEAKSSASAGTAPLSILAPVGVGCTMVGDMYTGETLAVANVGACFDIKSTGYEVSTATTYKPLMLTKYISTTKGEFAFNMTTGIEN